MGPTGIGKTDLAIELYDSANVEIISVDSVQVYKHLNIGSGKPDKKVLTKYPHKLIKVIDILGKDTNQKGFNIEIYDNGSVEKKYVIE